MIDVWFRLSFPLDKGNLDRDREWMRSKLPKAEPGHVIGLLGGSFDPPHAGHIHISREAMKRFGLGRVWWLVSPGNPLKEHGPAPIQQRMDACRALIRDPRIDVTDFESQVGTRFTAETLRQIFRHYPRQRFVWLMGADNLAGFHKWDRWEWIMDNIPIGVIARPGDRIAARLSPAANRYDRFRIKGRHSAKLAISKPPAWCFINAPMLNISSTKLRKEGNWHS